MDLDKQAEPLISGNQIISNTSQGIACWGGATPDIYQDGSDPPNELDQNGTSGPTPRANVYVEGFSLPFLGDYYGNKGNNNITHTTHYLVYSENTMATVKAEWNWWGSDPPNPSQFYGNVDYNPWRSSPATKVLVSFPSSQTLIDLGYDLYRAGQYE